MPAPAGDVIRFPYTGNRLHPTQKPIAALLPLVSAYSRRGELVLDPFAGSGTSGVAAARLGRRWTGIELDRSYCRIAVRRLERTVAA